MSDYIPDDVLVEILSRLPVISLLKFTEVCKKWHSLIINPTFISKHLEKTISKTNDENKILLVRHFSQYTRYERFTICFDNYRFDTHAELYFPFPRGNAFLKIIGTCNGLVCLVDLNISKDKIIIWNPCARILVNVPKPRLYCSKGTSILGFGFDSVNNDYKIVNAVYQITYDCHDRVPPNVEIYSLSTGVWKNICNVAPGYDSIRRYHQSPVFINGHVHWIGTCYDNNTINNCISAFDMSNEVFREVKMPKVLSKCEVLKLALLKWDKALALVEYPNIHQSDFCWIWKMNEYGVVESWVRLVRVDLSGGLQRKIVSLPRTNEVLISDLVHGLVRYHTDTQQFQCIGMYGTDWSFFVDSFVESLVLAERRYRALF